MRNLLIAVGAIVVIIILFFIWQLVLMPIFTPRGKVTIGNHTFSVEEAKTESAREKGLSGRGSLSDNNGMIFLFDKPDYYGFWMKDMKFPLDFIFINGDKIVTIYRNVPNPSSSSESPPVYKPSSPADKVLEISGGLSDQYSIKEGDTVQLSL